MTEPRNYSTHDLVLAFIFGETTTERDVELGDELTRRGVYNQVYELFCKLQVKVDNAINDLE